MTNHPEERDPQHQGDPKDPHAPIPKEEAFSEEAFSWNDVEEVIDGNIEVDPNSTSIRAKEPAPKTPLPQPYSEPTRISPMEMNEADGVIVHSHVEPQHSYLGPQIAPHKEVSAENPTPEPAPQVENPPAPAFDPHEENAGVLEDEPVWAQKNPDPSSIVDAGEIVEENEDKTHDVLEDEHHQTTEESSVVDISALVEEGSSSVLAEEWEKNPEESSVVSAISASAVIPDSGLVPSDIVEATSGATPIAEYHDDEIPLAKPVMPVQSPPPSLDEDLFHDEAIDDVEEIIEPEEIEPGVIVEGHTPVKAHVEEDVVDLGSDPAMDIAEPSGVEEAQIVVHQPDETGEVPPTVEIDWDEVGTFGDSKVVKTEDDNAPTVTLEKGPAQENKNQAKDEIVTIQDVVEEEDSSAVDLGQKGNGKSLSGVDLVAEELESDVHLDQHDTKQKTSPQGKDSYNSPEDETDLDAAPLQEEDVQFDDDEISAAHLKKAKGVVDDSDEIGAAAMLDEDDMPVSRRKKAAYDDEKGFALQEPADISAQDKLEDEEEAKEGYAVSEAEAEPVDKQKKAKKKGNEDRELVGAGAGKGSGKRGWLVGSLLSTLLLGGAAAGIWYAKPDLLEQAYKSSPSYIAPKKEKAKIEPPVVRARALMDNKQFDQAVNLLKDADQSPVNLSTRGEARWYKYLQEQLAAKKPLSKDAADVKLALADLKEAGNDLLATQITKTLAEGGLIANGKGNNDQNLVQLKEMAAKAEAAQKDAEQKVSSIADVLVKDKYLDDKANLNPASLQKILKGLSENNSGLASINKLLEDAQIKEGGNKGVTLLLSAKKDADEKLEAMNKLLADEKLKDDGPKGLAEIIAARNKLAKDRDDLDQVIKEAYKDLTGGQIQPNDDARAKIVDAIKTARLQGESPLAATLNQLAQGLSGVGTGVGQMVGKSFDMAALTGELAYYRMREPFIDSPERKMDSYIALFQNSGGNDLKLVGIASKEAAWVLSKESRSTSEARAKALVVLGLAQRNQANVETAKKNLAEALQAGAVYKDAPWMKQAAHSLKELNEPAILFLPKAEKFAAEGNYKAAQEALDLGLKSFPNDPRMLALRSLVRLESAQGQRSLIEAAQKDIRQDAETAAKNADAASEAAYALGLLEEELGNYEKAEAEYRQAIKTHKGNPDEVSRYVIALARVLQKDRFSYVPAPQIKENQAVPNKKEEADPKKEQETLERIRNLLTLALVGVQFSSDADEENPASAARIQESLDLANQLIRSANPKVKGQGYLILGQALSKKGRRTEGMKEYAKGLELLYPGNPSKDLAKLIEEHPAFQLPDALKANSVLAEQFFAKGLEHFWTRNYPEAETQFKKAIQFYNQDARYLYFLGMSLYNQKSKLKRDAAIFTFEQAARLEAANRPSMAEINSSLERIQGPQRIFLDSFRQKAVTKAN